MHIDDRRLFPSYSVFVLQCSRPYCLKNAKFGQLILRKNIKIVATTCQFLRPKCTKVDFGWGKGRKGDGEELHLPSPQCGILATPLTPDRNKFYLQKRDTVYETCIQWTTVESGPSTSPSCQGPQSRATCLWCWPEPVDTPARAPLVSYVSRPLCVSISSVEQALCSPVQSAPNITTTTITIIIITGIIHWGVMGTRRHH